MEILRDNPLCSLFLQTLKNYIGGGSNTDVYILFFRVMMFCPPPPPPQKNIFKEDSERRGLKKRVYRFVHFWIMKKMFLLLIIKAHGIKARGTHCILLFMLHYSPSLFDKNIMWSLYPCFLDKIMSVSHKTGPWSWSTHDRFRWKGLIWLKGWSVKSFVPSA